MVTLATLSNLNDAYLLRSMLEASDIPAFIPDEHTCQVDWGYINAIGGVRVQIPDEFTSHASAVLKDFKNSSAKGISSTTEQYSESSVEAADNVALSSQASTDATRRKDTGRRPLILIILFVAVVFAVAIYEHRVAEGAEALRDGNAAFSKGDFGLAITKYSLSLESEKDERVYVMRALAYDNIGKYDDAIADYTHAISLDPNDEYARVNRGKAYSDKGDQQQAITDSTQATILDPKDTQAYFNRGDAYLALNKYDEAIADFSRAIQLDARDGNAYFNRAGAFDDMGDIAKAVADYSAVIEIDPKNENAYNSLAWDLATSPQASLRDGKKALTYATKGCELSDWKDGFALDTLAAAYAEAGDFQNAVKWENACLESGQVDSKMIVEAKKRLSLYEMGRPYRSENKGVQ